MDRSESPGEAKSRLPIFVQETVQTTPSQISAFTADICERNPASH